MSPFLITEFISPLVCEQIILNKPEYDTYIQQCFEDITPLIEEQFSTVVSYTYHLEQIQEGVFSSKMLSGNSEYSGQWKTRNDSSLVGFLFLNDYNDSVPLDISFEVYGGELQFPIYNFSIKPERGTIVIFPASPNFVFYEQYTKIGDLHQIVFNINSDYKFDIKNYPKNVSNWF